jgi:hypothetical protein
MTTRKTACYIEEEYKYENIYEKERMYQQALQLKGEHFEFP